MNDNERLFNLCRQFVEDQHINCAEAVYQSDNVLENACQFIEKVCDIVGYHKYHEDDE